MIKTLIFYIMLSISLIVSMFFGLFHMMLGAMKLEKMQTKLMLAVTKAWAKFMIFTMGVKVTIEGSENVPEGAVLFVSNHQSYFDIPALMVHTPHFAPFVAKVELLKAPMLSWWMKQMGCLFIDRSDMRQSLKIVLEGIEKLKGGQSLIIFPEGTRSKSNEMLEFKPGSLKLAVKAKVPIVPVTLKNSFKTFEEHGRIKGAEVLITFHEPIDVNTLPREELSVLHTTVRNIINKPLER